MSDDRDAADRLADATGRDREVFTADDLPLPELDDLSSVACEAIQNATEAFAAHEERELRGAWRAGYDRVDVYDREPAFGSGVGEITIERTYHPRNEGDPREVLDGYRYCFSYDLTSVPDDVLLDAIRSGFQTGSVIDRD